MTSIDFYAKNFGQARLLAKLLDLPINRLLGQSIRLTEAQHDLITTQIARLNSGYPLDYLLGTVSFCESDFIINPDVLIPRPATEYWVNQLITLLQEAEQDNISHTLKPFSTLVDIGTGSGIIGLTLAKYFDYTILTDISKKALAVASTNASILYPNHTNIQLIQTNLLEDIFLPKATTNWTLVANLPYVPTTDQNDSKKNQVSNEPQIALYSGTDGLDHIRELIEQVVNKHSDNLPTQIWLELDPRNICNAKNFIQEQFQKIKLKSSKKLIYNILTDEDDFARVLVIKQIDE